MKYFIIVALAFVVIASLPSGAAAQAPASITPEDTVRSFYQLYLHSLNQEEVPLDQHKAEFSKLVTLRLRRSYARAGRIEGGITVDFFLDAQDWDKDWEKNISVSKAVIRGIRATVNVNLKGGPAPEGGQSFDQKLKVGLRKEGGVWKIDTVNGHVNVT